MSQIRQKVGVFGGAFDPPHHAHVALAQAAITALALDTLHVIPTGQAWHKSRALSSAPDRLAMTRLAFQNMPRVVVDDREIKRAGPTYTIDTLLALQAETPDAQFYLALGADQFAAFKHWHRWQEILQIAIICIAKRPCKDWVADQYDTFPELRDRVLTLQMPPMAVSATQIRQLLAGGLGENHAMADLLPNPVARYIAQHRLYQAP